MQRSSGSSPAAQSRSLSEGGAHKDHEVQIQYVSSSVEPRSITHEGRRYRTLSLHVDSIREEKQKAAAAGKSTDPAAAIRQIDVHALPIDEVYTRFSTSPTVGLETDAITRRSKDGKNAISSPPTQYWKKAVNYVFGGFNFLMWIAFIVTIVCPLFS